MSNFYLIKFSGEGEEEYLYVLNEIAYNFLLNKFQMNKTNEIITTFPGSSGVIEGLEIITLNSNNDPPPPPPGGGAVRMVRISVQSIVDPNVNLNGLAAAVAQLLIDKDGAKPDPNIIENLFRTINEMKHNPNGGKKIGLRRRSSSSRRRRSTKRRTTSRKQQKRRRATRSRAH